MRQPVEFFKGSADRLCEVFHVLLGGMNVVQNNKILIKKVKPGTGSGSRSSVKPNCGWRTKLIVS